MAPRNNDGSGRARRRFGGSLPGGGPRTVLALAELQRLSGRNDLSGAEDPHEPGAEFMAENTATAVVNAVTPAQAAEMKRLGVRRVPVDTFHVGAFRYSNLADAIAQAERIAGKK